ncbi:MAG: nitrate reductase molybdenum cofactor assembly chaperone [Alphaproteobacteria bacterium]|nr:nitrate reductase molybdenum cofactor assembly chaperone [Alphaproteobacteria bacterium]
MKTYRALGALLTYPTEELIEALPEIRAVLVDERLIAASHIAAIDGLLDHLSAGDLMDLQDEYVRLFDRMRSLSLHLYEHLYGEARERGQAMVRLQTLYKFHGFSHTSGELPDYLPLFAEFLSLMTDRTARTILSDAAPTIEALHQRAAKKETSYAAVFAALVSMAAKQVDRTLLAEIMRGGGAEDDSLDALDRAWEDAPVTFGEGDAAKSLEPMQPRG